MAGRGRPKAPLVPTGEERATLERWARRPRSAQSLALRCRIVLACAAGLDNKVVVARLHVNQATVSKWRQRFLARRLDGLGDDPRPGAVRTITDDMVEAVIVKTREGLSEEATHWSTRSMAREMGMSQSAISRIWRAFGLKPHLVDTCKLSNDPQFVDKVRDVVSLYLNPPEEASGAECRRR
ncbi:MAG: helix-turn-helix domain-containing protein [Acidimicrobiales bacterium]